MVLDLRCTDVHVRRCGVAQEPFQICRNWFVVLFDYVPVCFNKI